MRSSSVFLMNASAAAIVLSASPAYAQPVGNPEVVIPESAAEDAEDQAEGAPEEPVVRNADGSTAQGGVITVTGTRIRLPNLESVEPITTIDNRQITDRNFTNVADALNELPIFRGSVTPAGAQGSFGQGVNFVNTYGIGSNRTLTLVNGRRFVTSNVPSLFGNASAGTQVDLNVIPQILVDRIDAVATGGAPIYGSDAIAGTVNIILRTRYDGNEVTGLTGITEQGDNFRYNVSGLFGRDFAGGRANVTVAISHDEVDGLVYNDRDFVRTSVQNVTNPCTVVTPFCPAANRVVLPGRTPQNDLRLNPGIGFNNTPTDLNPGLVLARGVTIPYLSPGGVISSGSVANRLQFDPNGNLIPFNQGVLYPGIFGAGGEGFTFEQYSQITSDLNRTIGNAFFTFDITDNVELFLEGTHFRSRADELVQQPTFNSTLFGGTSAAVVFRNDNPFLTDQARQTLVASGVTNFSVSRASNDFADLTGFNETRIWRMVGGLRGDFSVFGRNWNFEAYANWGQTNSNDYRQDVNAQNFINAVNVTRNAQGQIVCTTAQTRGGGNGFAAPGGTPIADPNCVPLNLFGAGRASQAALDYIIEDSVTRTRLEQTVFNINFGGGLFNIWGGEIGFNIGYEHREEFGNFRPSEFDVAGRGRGAAVSPVKGGYNLEEVFGELVVPFVSPETNLSFLHSAQLFARGRYVHNTVNGGFFSYALGGTLSPVQDIEFRGNFTRSFRSPAITELFLPISPGFNFVNDLCSATNRVLGPNPAIRTRNCLAFLAVFPNATPLQAANASVPSLSGGNPNLENEQADSWTAGVIIRPRFLPRFSASVDYVSITLGQPIANLTSAQIVSACFDNENFNLSDPANGNEFCQRIRRFPAGTIGTLPNGTIGDIGGQVPADPADPAVRTGFVNGNEISFRGIQATLNYSLPLDMLNLDGTFQIGGDLLYVKSRIVDITGVAPSRSDGIIAIADPEFSGQLRMRYVEDQWGINTTLNYVGEQLFARTNRTPGPGSGPDAREIDELDDFILVNGGLWFDPTPSFRLTFAVNNLFNRFGQRYFGEIIPASYTTAAGGDLLGRRFSASARLRF